MNRTAITVALVFLVVGACQQTQQGPASKYVRTEIFEDVPAPKGAVYREQEGQSFSYSSDHFRCGKFVYDYSATAEDAVAFFKETMTQPPYSWVLKDESWRPAEGIAALTLVKNEDRCTVDVKRTTPPGAEEPQVSLVVRVNYNR